MKKSVVLVIFLFLFLTQALKSQINHGGIPYGYNVKNTAIIPQINLPALDNSVLSEANSLENKLKGRWAYGKSIEVNIDPYKQGVWTNIKGGRLWQIIVYSEGAYSLAVRFGKFIVPQGAKLYIYNVSKTYHVGSFGAWNNRDGLFPVSNVAGDKIIIEYFEPDSAKFKGDFFIDYIVHDFGDLLGTQKSQSCEVDINCSEGDDWQIIKHSVCKYTFEDNGMSYVCSGSLVNNTDHDARPYFLTANHCISTDGQANTAVFYFNFEADKCGGSYTDENQTVSGAFLRATGSDNTLDFTLLEMKEQPPESYMPVFAGWSRTLDVNTKVFCIHHPDGDIKKISGSKSSPTVSTFPDYTTDRHWNIAEWEFGTTENGSSGSPLFDANQRIIGDLTGGEASCTYNYNDYFQIFKYAFEEYNVSSKSLRLWLDPATTNVDTLDWFDPYMLFTEFVPPEDLALTVSDKSVELTWKKPTIRRSGTLAGFKVYRENVVIKTITDTTQISFTDSNLEDGKYVYYITSVYENPQGESSPSNLAKATIGQTSADSKSISEFKIFPNPAKNFIQIFNENMIFSYVKIFDLSGKCLISEHIKAGTNRIYITSLNTGLYIIEAYGNGKIIHAKFFKR